MMTKENKIPNTIQNQTKIRHAVAEFMVEQVLTKEQIVHHAMAYLESTFENAGHTIGDLAAMVKKTDIPKAHPSGPEQPNRILCFGTLHNEEPEDQYYFFTKTEDFEYSALEVKGAE